MENKVLNSLSTPQEMAQDESFDSILRKLQSIVEQLERGDLSLEDSLQAFEQGISLSRRGQSILDAAEKRVEILLREGTIETFDPPTHLSNE